jgi:tetratricopeptide (TPR) repeat protein
MHLRIQSKTIMKLLITISVALLLNISNVFSQAKEEDVFDHKLMFNDLYGIKEYKDALPHIIWLSNNAPDVDVNVHIKGVRVLDKLMKEATEEEKSEYKELALKLYEQRIQYFGVNATVKSLQLTAAYRYFAKDLKQYDRLLGLFETSISDSLELMSNANFLSYFDILRRVKKYKNQVDEEKVLNNYGLINTIMTARNKNDGYDSKIESFLVDIVVLNCASIEDVFGSKLEDNLEQVGIAKMLVNLSLKNGCTNSEVFKTAIGYVAKYAPTTNVLIYMAKKAMGDNQLSEAEMHFGKALSLNENNEVKSNIYYNLAMIYTLKNQKSKAQEFAYKSINTNNNKEAYSLIGSLYLSSFNECVGENDIIVRRSVFIAAYDMFKKAGDEENMAIAKENFPSAEEIFMNGYILGQELKVECWFKETVSIQKRG